MSVEKLNFSGNWILMRDISGCLNKINESVYFPCKFLSKSIILEKISPEATGEVASF